MNSQEALKRVLAGLDHNLTGDLLAEDIRMALNELGSTSLSFVD